VPRVAKKSNVVDKTELIVCNNIAYYNQQEEEDRRGYYRLNHCMLAEGRALAPQNGSGV
jgi:hypothetical protein